LLERVLYRCRQFFAALRPRIDEGNRAEAAEFLGEPLFQLFDSMAVRDQQHCFQVYRTLRDRGCGDRHLLTAALLHDAGKGRLSGARVRLWHRVAYVALAAGTPGLLRRIARGRGGLACIHEHAQRGAMLAEALGAPARVVELILLHEERGLQDEAHLQLRLADDSC
jgi:hypothetical protein